MQASHVAGSAVRVRPVANRLPAFLTLIAGLIIIYCIGFSHLSVVHNGTHDTRHAKGFPCH
jgi:cobalt transporter subunit CbtB